MEMTYYAAIYARISSDHERKLPSESEKEDTINAQIELVKNYIMEAKQKGGNIEIFDIYKDIGKTGSSFVRKEFLRMMEDIRARKVNCVIVKDLSRFGRDYIETGNYIDKIFPFLGVRFIAVTEQYDTNNLDKNNKIAVDIKNLINDIYVKDASYKAKIQLKQRRDSGAYVGGPAPYGYKLAKLENKQKLIVDAAAKDIVQFIFKAFIKERSCTAVAKILSEKKIYPPLQYKKTNVIYSSKSEEWNRSSVERIIKNVTYLGILAQGKTSITGRDERTRMKKEEKDWVVRQKCHAPIVDVETFQKAQEIMQEICQKSSKQRKIEGRTDLSEYIIKYFLRTQFIIKVKYPLSTYENKSREADRKLERLMMTESEQYFSYCQGELEKEQYTELLRKSREDERKLRYIIKNQKENLEYLLKGIEELNITGEILNLFIENICIYPNQKIHIKFSFK